jgi:DNA replication protein DnaC
MNEQLIAQLKEYRLYGILCHQDEVSKDKTMFTALEQFLAWEKAERITRKFKQTMQGTCLHKYSPYRPMGEFEWDWPEKIDRDQITELFSLDFLKEAVNVIFFGPSGVGKTSITKNIVEKAAREGKKAVFKECADILDDLLGKESTLSVRDRLEKYARYELLAIDEVGYLSYDTRHADVLFQLIQKRAGRNSTIITTNRPFSEWRELFPNAASVSALIDRLIERCEIVQIDGPTYRGKLFKERQERRSSPQKGKVSHKSSVQPH